MGTLEPWRGELPSPRSQPHTEPIPRELFFKRNVRELLEAFRGSRLIARGEEKGCEILHYLLPNGRVVEIVKTKV